VTGELFWTGQVDAGDLEKGEDSHKPTARLRHTSCDRRLTTTMSSSADSLSTLPPPSLHFAPAAVAIALPTRVQMVRDL
jgi:hypothetical protein